MSSTDAGTGTVTYTYNFNDILQATGPPPTGEHAKQKQLEYDGLGRLASVCEMTVGTTPWPGGSCAQANPQTGYWTKYAYDFTNGYRRVTVTQNAQSGTLQTRTYLYDLLGRLVSETNPETGTTTYVYDSDSTGNCNWPSASYYGSIITGNYPGDLVRMVDNAGNQSCYQYDGLHRLTLRIHPYGPSYCARGAGSPCSTPDQYFVYDSATVNGVAMSNAKGTVAEAYTCVGACASKITDEGFSYSVRGELTDTYESTLHSGGYFHPTAAYWPNGALETLWISSLPAMTYAVDGEGRTSKVSATSGQNPVTATSYNIFSEVTGVTLGSGDSDSFGFDANTGRMTQYKYTVRGSSEIGNLTWNPNGSLKTLAITDPFNAGDAQTCNYSHDDLSRIATANCGSAWSQTFSVDPFGNVNKTGSISWTTGYTAATNQYTLAGTHYDANGNLTADTFHGYTWDADGNPLTIDSIGLTYDAFDRVVEQNQSGTYYQIVYTPMGTKLGLFKGQTIQQLYIPLPGGDQAEYLSWGLSHYRHADWLGSDRMEASPAHAILDSNAYAPFGEPYAQTGNGEISFTGQNKDTDWLQYDFLARQYDPKQGRWISPDPAGLAAVDPTNPQSWNRYAYVGNSPLSSVDPLGLVTHTPAPGGCANGTTLTLWNDGSLTCQAPCPQGYTVWNGWMICGPPANISALTAQLQAQANAPQGPQDSGSAANSGCLTPSAVQSAVIPAVATAAKFWNKTLLFGLGASGGAGFGKGFGMYGSGSVQIAVSPSGAAAYVFTFAAPASVTGAGTYGWVTPSTKGAGFLAGSQFGFSNATDPSQLAGPGIDASGSLAAGIGIGADSSVSIGGNFPYQFNVTLGFGAGGRGAAGAKTNTAVVPICHN